jgi:hypothetical protein
MHLLAYIPFVDPIHAMHDWWYVLLLPLSLGVAVIYRALRMSSLEHYWRQVWLMTLQIVLALGALAVVLVALVQLAIPWLPVD